MKDWKPDPLCQILPPSQQSFKVARWLRGLRYERDKLRAMIEAREATIDFLRRKLSPFQAFAKKYAAEDADDLEAFVDRLFSERDDLRRERDEERAKVERLLDAAPPLQVKAEAFERWDGFHWLPIAFEDIKVEDVIREASEPEIHFTVKTLKHDNDPPYCEIKPIAGSSCPKGPRTPRGATESGKGE